MVVEDGSHGVTGSGAVLAPCGFPALTILGRNVVSGVLDSVSLNFSGSNLGSFVFQGTFRALDALGGLMNGASCIDCPTSLVRSPLTPIKGAIENAQRFPSTSVTDRRPASRGRGFH